MHVTLSDALLQEFMSSKREEGLLLMQLQFLDAKYCAQADINRQIIGLEIGPITAEVTKTTVDIVYSLYLEQIFNELAEQARRDNTSETEKTFVHESGKTVLDHKSSLFGIEIDARISTVVLKVPLYLDPSN